MYLMKRLGLIAVLVILGGLFAASPLLAGKNADAGIWLYAPAGSPEPDASGVCTFKQVKNLAIVLEARVECVDLTPNQRYVLHLIAIDGSITEYPVTTDRKGNLTARLRVFPTIFVLVENAAGVVVLEGSR